MVLCLRLNYDFLTDGLREILLKVGRRLIMIERGHGGRGILGHARLLQRANRRDQLLLKYQLLLLKLKLLDAHHDVIRVVRLRALGHPDILEVVDVVAVVASSNVIAVRVIYNITARSGRELLQLLLLLLLRYLLLDVHPLVEELRVHVAVALLVRRLLASLRLFSLFMGSTVGRAERVRRVIDQVDHGRRGRYRLVLLDQPAPRVAESVRARRVAHQLVRGGLLMVIVMVVMLVVRGERSATA